MATPGVGLGNGSEGSAGDQGSLYGRSICRRVRRRREFTATTALSSLPAAGPIPVASANARFALAAASPVSRDRGRLSSQFSARRCLSPRPQLRFTAGARARLSQEVAMARPFSTNPSESVSSSAVDHETRLRRWGELRCHDRRAQRRCPPILDRRNFRSSWPRLLACVAGGSFDWLLARLPTISTATASLNTKVPLMSKHMFDPKRPYKAVQ